MGPVAQMYVFADLQRDDTGLLLFPCPGWLVCALLGLSYNGGR